MEFAEVDPNTAGKAGGGRSLSLTAAHVLVWKSRPVFLSSTFRDMHKDRDYLRAHAFPEIEERLRQRGHYLETIDLRQGVETAGLESEEARELKVLKVCLDEILRSRPFFIALLGDRYGWIPPAERMAAASRAAGFAVGATGSSVTEIEILRGVMNAPDQSSRSWFYFREMDYSGMPPEKRRDFDERVTGGGLQAAPDELAAALERAGKLDALKRHIRRQLPDRCRSYRVRWDSPQEGLNELARMVVADLWSDLDLETREYLRTAPKTEAEAEWREIDDFIVERTRGFVERPAVSARMLRHTSSPISEESSWALAVTGESGSGKSSFFGRVYAELRGRDDILLLGHAAGISAGAGRVDRMLRRFVGELAKFLGEPDPIPGFLDLSNGRRGMEAAPSPRKSLAEQIEEAFAELLDRAAERKRVVVLIDALDQFEPTVRARYLTWIPKSWPKNARFLATSIPGPVAKALFERAGAEEYKLPEVDRSEASEIARAFSAGRYHREVNARAMDALLNKRLPDGRPAHNNPLWLALALQESNLLEADDYERADSEFGLLPPASRMEALQVQEAGALPSDASGVYGRLLARTERDNGSEWTRALLNVIGLSLSGWRESDLHALVPAVSGLAWEDLIFAGVRRALGPHLVQRGAEAQWDFFHAQLRQAVLDRNLADAGERRALHGRIASHLLELTCDDFFRCVGTIFHLAGASAAAPAAHYLAGLESGSAERAGAVSTLVSMIEAGQAAGDGTAMAEWLGGVLRDGGLMPLELSDAAQLLLGDLDQALGVEQKSEADRGRVLEAVIAALRFAISSRGGEERWERDLAFGLAKLGDWRLQQGDTGDALERHRESLALRERLRTRTPANANLADDLAKSYGSLGSLHHILGDSRTALECFQKCSALYVQLQFLNQWDPDLAQNLAAVYDRMGDVQIALGDGVKALELSRKCLAIAEDLHRHDPQSVHHARNLAVCHVRLAQLRQSWGDGQGALESYHLALDAAEDLRARHPQIFDLARDLAFICAGLSVLHRGRGDGRKALDYGEKALVIAEDWQARHPRNAELAKGIVQSCLVIGDLHRGLGDVQKAMDSYKKALDINESLRAREPERDDLAWDLAASFDRLGDMHLGQDDASGALELYRKSLSLAEDLWTRHPQNEDFARILSISRSKLGDLHLGLGEGREALERYAQALSLAEDLRARHPQRDDLARDCSVFSIKLGDVFLGQGNGKEARESYEMASASIEDLQRRGSRDIDLARSLAASYDGLGDLYLGQKAEPRAMEAYTRSYELRENHRAGGPPNDDLDRDLSISCTKIGDLHRGLGDGPKSLDFHKRALAIAESLRERNPGNADFGRDLWTGYLRMARAAEQGFAKEAQAWWMKAYAVLSAMKQGGAPISPEDEKWLVYIRQKAGQ